VGYSPSESKSFHLTDTGAHLVQVSFGDFVQRQAKLHPRLETAFERVDFGDACAFELQRHTGASGFVRSSAIQDDFVIVWDFV
jgi:hypothetical protein